MSMPPTPSGKSTVRVVASGKGSSWFSDTTNSNNSKASSNSLSSGTSGRRVVAGSPVTALNRPKSGSGHNNSGSKIGSVDFDDVADFTQSTHVDVPPPLMTVTPGTARGGAGGGAGGEPAGMLSLVRPISPSSAGTPANNGSVRGGGGAGGDSGSVFPLGSTSSIPDTTGTSSGNNTGPKLPPIKMKSSGSGGVSGGGLSSSNSKQGMMNSNSHHSHNNSGSRPSNSGSVFGAMNSSVSSPVGTSSSALLTRKNLMAKANSRGGDEGGDDWDDSRSDRSDRTGNSGISPLGGLGERSGSVVSVNSRNGGETRSMFSAHNDSKSMFGPSGHTTPKGSSLRGPGESPRGQGPRRVVKASNPIEVSDAEKSQSSSSLRLDRSIVSPATSTPPEQNNSSAGGKKPTPPASGRPSDRQRPGSRSPEAGLNKSHSNGSGEGGATKIVATPPLETKKAVTPPRQRKEEEAGKIGGDLQANTSTSAGRFTDSPQERLSTKEGSEVLRQDTSDPRAGEGEQDEDRYSVFYDQLIGKGGFGAVYKGFDMVLAKHVAVKRAPCDFGGEGDLSTRDGIKAEWELLTSLKHENVVPVMTFIPKPEEGCAEIVMELMNGGSVLKVIDEQHFRLHEGIIKRYAKDALKGLVFLHGKGVLHRDIKPGNMLMDNGTVKLSDFGTSKLAKGGGSGEVPLTTALNKGTCEDITVNNKSNNNNGSFDRENFLSSGSGNAAVCGITQPHQLLRHQSNRLVGTSAYLCWESIANGEYSEGSDMWAMGCSLVEMAQGLPPWSELPEEKRGVIPLMFHIGGSTEPPCNKPEIPGHLSPELQKLIRRCFEHDPKERITAKSMLADPYFSGSEGLPKGAETLATYRQLQAQNDKDRNARGRARSIVYNTYQSTLQTVDEETFANLKK